jgi:hypothetical protein
MKKIRSSDEDEYRFGIHICVCVAVCVCVCVCVRACVSKGTQLGEHIHHHEIAIHVSTTLLSCSLHARMKTKPDGKARKAKGAKGAVKKPSVAAATGPAPYEVAGQLNPEDFKTSYVLETEKLLRKVGGCAHRIFSPRVDSD